jgi:WD40 repeat protein
MIAQVEFSGDGRRLAIGDVTFLRFLAVPSWQELRKIPGGPFTFSPDSALVAVETGEGSIRLVDPESGREYARLEDPGQDRAQAMTFSPDGALLVTVGRNSHTIHAWDLREIRDQLTRRGLDWEAPPYPKVAADAAELVLAGPEGELPRDVFAPECGHR